MRIVNRKILVKLKAKNIGNKKLCLAIDQLLLDLDKLDSRLNNLASIRQDADCVHSEGFYFLNIHVHRVLVLILLDEEDAIDIIWAGSHDEYERTFKNNKTSIEKWLRKQGYIDS